MEEGAALFVVLLRPKQSTLVFVSLASDGPDVENQLRAAVSAVGLGIATTSSCSSLVSARSSACLNPGSVVSLTASISLVASHMSLLWPNKADLFETNECWWRGIGFATANSSGIGHESFAGALQR